MLPYPPTYHLAALLILLTLTWYPPTYLANATLPTHPPTYIPPSTNHQPPSCSADTFTWYFLLPSCQYWTLCFAASSQWSFALVLWFVGSNTFVLCLVKIVILSDTSWEPLCQRLWISWCKIGELYDYETEMKIYYAQKDPQLKICAASLLCTESPTNDSLLCAEIPPNMSSQIHC